MTHMTLHLFPEYCMLPGVGKEFEKQKQPAFCAPEDATKCECEALRFGD